MFKTPSTLNRLFVYLIAVSALAGLAIQFYLTVRTLNNFIFYISFFTILTNLLVAVAFTTRFAAPHTKMSNYFFKPSTLAAITLYIVVVGLVYNVVLRWLWQPRGLQLLADNLLHVVTPVLCLLYWLLFYLKSRLRWQGVFSWLWYPGIYLVYALIRGAVTNQYPYPFINAAEIGYPKTFINAVVMLAVFVGLGMLLVGITRVRQNKSK